jgi:two-component system response regulator MprA
MATKLGVLVVDDDPDIRTFMGCVLEDSGYEVRSAADGGAALELLQDWQPDLILLDLMMPRVDGRAFRRAQLEQDALAAIPVVVMSAGYSAHSEAERLAAAAALDKPFDLNLVLETVAALAG